MSSAGAANIQDWVTIDLGLMKDVTVSRDSTTVSVGSGARWQDVYLKLDVMNLSVAGGRVYDVGVGGLVLGGKKLRHFLQPSFVANKKHQEAIHSLRHVTGLLAITSRILRLVHFAQSVY